ncbi:MAG: hypothetical protein C0501_09850 [Isosphaera sp.]|nr:hypothetical protein [Isosphaera sp.]
MRPSRKRERRVFVFRRPRFRLGPQGNPLAAARPCRTMSAVPSHGVPPMRLLPLALFAAALPAVLPAAAAQPAPVKAHTALVHAVAVSPDGKTVATGGFDNVIKLWDVAPDGTLKEKKELKGHTGPVYALVFHPKDAVLVSGSQDKTAKVWSLADGKVTAEFKGHTDIVHGLAFAPDGKAVASGSVDKSVKLWSPADGKELKALGAHGGSVYAVAFSPDGKALVSASADKLAKVWDVAGGKELKQLVGHEDAVTAVTFAGDADTVVTASTDRTIRVWSVKAVKEVPKKDEKKEPPKDVKKDDKKDPKDKKDDKKEPPKKDDKKEEPKRDAKAAGEVKLLGPTADDPFAVAWSPEAKALAVCSYSGLVTVWKLDGDKPTFTRAVKNPGYCVAFGKDGKVVLTGHDNGTVAVTPVGGK